MRIKILGCSGGIGRNRHTTSMLLDDDVLIDAGTGLTKLTLQQLAKVDHVFLTHAHMDHIACLPMLVDSVAQLRSKPITVYCNEETRDALKRHIFNWLIWPDFTILPSLDKPVLQFQLIEVDQVVSINHGRNVRALPAAHQVPAVGYCFECDAGAFVFTGDTAECPELWDRLRVMDQLKVLVIESAFSDQEEALATRAGHLTPALVAKASS